MATARTIEEVVDTLRNSKRQKRACSLLVGAGASVTAGIPAAAGFVNEIRQRFPAKFRTVSEPKTYPKCMAALFPSEVRDLISEYVDNAKINWAHVCVALLIEHGYVDRVLTTNFDPLASLIYHEAALEVRFVRGSAGSTSILTIRDFQTFGEIFAEDNRLVRPFRVAGQLASYSTFIELLVTQAQI